MLNLDTINIDKKSKIKSISTSSSLSLGLSTRNLKDALYSEYHGQKPKKIVYYSNPNNIRNELYMYITNDKLQRLFLIRDKQDIDLIFNNFEFERKQIVKFDKINKSIYVINDDTIWVIDFSKNFKNKSEEYIKNSIAAQISLNISSTNPVFEIFKIQNTIDFDSFKYSFDPEFNSDEIIKKPLIELLKNKKINYQHIKLKDNIIISCRNTFSNFIPKILLSKKLDNNNNCDFLIQDRLFFNNKLITKETIKKQIELKSNSLIETSKVINENLNTINELASTVANSSMYLIKIKNNNISIDFIRKIPNILKNYKTIVIENDTQKAFKKYINGLNFRIYKGKNNNKNIKILKISKGVNIVLYYGGNNVLDKFNRNSNMIINFQDLYVPFYNINYNLVFSIFKEFNEFNEYDNFINELNEISINNKLYNLNNL